MLSCFCYLLLASILLTLFDGSLSETMINHIEFHHSHDDDVPF